MLAPLALVAALLSACGPAEQPEPTPTAAFADEEEAYAAAEEVYRAYNDAGNARRAGEDADPQTFLVGAALGDDIEALSVIEASDVHLVGDVTTPQFVPINADLGSTPVTVTAVVCLDLSSTQVVDANGNDVTPTDRELIRAQEVTFVSMDSSLRISAERSVEVDQCQ